MKKIYYLAVALLLLSCNKEPEIPENVFTFNLNGQPKNYTSNLSISHNELFGTTIIMATDAIDTIQMILTQTETGVFSKENEREDLQVNDLFYYTSQNNYVSSDSAAAYEIAVYQFNGDAQQLYIEFDAKLISDDKAIVDISNGVIRYTRID